MKKDINIEIGERIKKKRKSLKMTREELAEIVDISPQFLANIECGKKGMSFTTLKNLCFALGTSCDYIILGKEPSGCQSRIAELLSNVGEEYIPALEGIINQTLRIIALAEKKNTKGQP